MGRTERRSPCRGVIALLQLVCGKNVCYGFGLNDSGVEAIKRTLRHCKLKINFEKVQGLFERVGVRRLPDLKPIITDDY